MSRRTKNPPHLDRCIIRDRKYNIDTCHFLGFDAKNLQYKNKKKWPQIYTLNDNDNLFITHLFFFLLITCCLKRFIHINSDTSILRSHNKLDCQLTELNVRKKLAENRWQCISLITWQQISLKLIFEIFIISKSNILHFLTFMLHIYYQFCEYKKV